LSYSIDLIKKSAFQDELTNVLELKANGTLVEDAERMIVIEYLKRRIREIDKTVKS
jgi:hypothetical protein